jgi:hypothetical protein
MLPVGVHNIDVSSVTSTYHLLQKLVSFLTMRSIAPPSLSRLSLQNI